MLPSREAAGWLKACPICFQQLPNPDRHQCRQHMSTIQSSWLIEWRRAVKVLWVAEPAFQPPNIGLADAQRQAATSEVPSLKWLSASCRHNFACAGQPNSQSAHHCVCRRDQRGATVKFHVGRIDHKRVASKPARQQDDDASGCRLKGCNHRLGHS